MASPFSGRAGRLAGMWAAGQATQGLGDIMTTLREAEGNAGGYLTEGYATGQDVLAGGYADSMEALRQGYGTGRADLMGAHRLANANLTQGRDRAADLMRGGYASGERQLLEGQGAGVGALTAGRDQGINALYGGRDQALGYLGQGGAQLQGAADAYNPLIQRGMAGYDMYSNSLGINGPEGNAAARGAFRAGPGYQWQVEQATDAAQRAANRTGSLYGGNVVDATTRLGSNLANQEYGNWQNRLQPYQGAALAATTGRAQQLDLLAQNYGRMGDVSTTAGQGAANLYGTTGNQLSNLYSTTGNQLANLSSSTGQAIGNVVRGTAQDLSNLDARMGAAQAGMAVDEGQQYANTNTNYGSQLASLAGGYGGSMASLITGTAGNIAQAQQAANNTITQAGTQGLLAGQQAATNTWGAILGGLGAGTKLLSGSSGGLLSSLFK